MNAVIESALIDHYDALQDEDWSRARQIEREVADHDEDAAEHLRQNRRSVQPSYLRT